METEASTTNVSPTYSKMESCLYIIPAGNDLQGPPTTVLGTPKFQAQGVLIKKPADGWPGTPETICFMVTAENVRFTDEATLGELLDETCKKGEFFSVAKTTRYTKDDKNLIDVWASILKGQYSPDLSL